MTTRYIHSEPPDHKSTRELSSAGVWLGKCGELYRGLERLETISITSWTQAIPNSQESDGRLQPISFYCFSHVYTASTPRQGMGFVVFLCNPHIYLHFSIYVGKAAPNFHQSARMA